MRQSNHPLRTIALACGLIGTAFSASAAGTFTVQNGTWVVTSEVNGQPGRGMAIDVQDGILVMQVYNYDNTGQPTFHLSFGAMSGNHYSGTLQRYKNGRYYGSGPLDAVEAEAPAGTVQIDFDSASTGTIQFPGESPVAISRFNFDQIPSGQFTRTSIADERWLMAELDDTGKPINALLVNTAALVFSPSPQAYPALTSVQSYLDGTTSAPTNCTYSSSTGYFSCAIAFGGASGTRTLQWAKHLEGMSGKISGAGTCQFSPCPPTWRKVVGMRLGLDYSTTPTQAQMDVRTPEMTPARGYSVTPDPGTWIVSSELTGKPGRGMAIDVQYDTLVMQVYNYEASGASTFHLAVAPYSNGAATGHLKRYEGGRYFGGPAQSGHEAADVGTVQFSFTTPTQGTIQFPGESAVAIERYQFGATAPTPESIYGGWMVFDAQNNQLHYYTLNQLDADPTVATGTGASFSIRCNYPSSNLGYAVKCTDQTPVSIDNYRFTPVNGRAIGSHDGSGTSSASPIYVLRVKDRNGNLAGLGKF